MLRLASRRAALPTRRAPVRLLATKPPLPPPETTPLPAPASIPLPPPSTLETTAAAAPVPPPPAAPAAEAPPTPTPEPLVQKADASPKVEIPKPSAPKMPEIPPAPPIVHHAAAAGRGAASRLRSLLKSTLLFLGTGALLVYAYDSRAGIHRYKPSLSCPFLPSLGLLSALHDAAGWSSRHSWP